MARPFKNKSKKSKKTKSEKAQAAQKAKALLEEENAPRVPRSFVFHRGKVGTTVDDLETDIRNVMSPNTASHLQERASNKIQEFKDAALPLKVTHFFVLGTTLGGSTHLRVSRLPKGPSLTFNVLNFSLAKDVQKLLNKMRSPTGAEYQKAPLVVLNIFA